MLMASEQLRTAASWIGKLELMWPDWEKESYPEVRDLALIPLFAIFFPTLRFFLDKFVFGGTKEAHKVQGVSLEVFIFFSAEVFVLAITYNEPWFTDSKMFWVGPAEQQWPHLMTRLKLKVLYGFAGGFYSYSIFALIFWETRRSDFGVSMSHHIASVFLIVFSYLARFARVGSVVLAIHDASDVFLEIGKLTKYYGLEIVPSIAFVLFALQWVLLRLIYFPFHVIWSTSYEVLQVLDTGSYKQGLVLYYIFNTLLISLFVIHIYWWILIFRMLVKQVAARGRVSDDVRSDDDDDDEDTGKED